MGEGFKKQKRKYLQGAIIKSAVCALSFALFCVGVVLLALKRAGIPLNAGYYVLIALSAAILCGGVSFLFFRPVNKKIALNLDNRYGLDEKVQTALAYMGEEGAVVDMLQSDTDKKLLNLPKNKFSLARVWQYFLIGLLSLAVIFSAVLVPSKIVEGETEIPSDAPYTFSDSQMDDLQELIDNVKASHLADTLKNASVESLNKLMNNLIFAETNSEMSDYVNRTVQDIEKIIKEPLSYKRIANSLGSASLNGLAKMVAQGVQVFKDYAIVEYTDTQTFYEERVSAVTVKNEEQLTEFLGVLEEGDADDVLVGVIEKTYTNIYMALNLSQVGKDDALYTVLFDFAKGLAQNDNRLTNETALKFDLEFNGELAEQAYLLAMNKYITNTLRDIFGMKIPADESFVPTYSEEQDGDDGKGGSSQGGYGQGDMLYGSDDEVYHPALGYVKYGEILKEYYAIVEALLREGNLTEEQQAVLRAYFEILWSGIPAEE